MVAGKDKEEWELRYEHERDNRDSLLESNGMPPVIDRAYGELKSTPPGAFLRFNGPKFWPIFKSKGHSHCRFEECEYRKNK